MIAEQPGKKLFENRLTRIEDLLADPTLIPLPDMREGGMLRPFSVMQLNFHRILANDPVSRSAPVLLNCLDVL